MYFTASPNKLLNNNNKKCWQSRTTYELITRHSQSITKVVSLLEQENTCFSNSVWSCANQFLQEDDANYLHMPEYTMAKIWSSSIYSVC